MGARERGGWVGVLLVLVSWGSPLAAQVLAVGPDGPSGTFTSAGMRIEVRTLVRDLEQPSGLAFLDEERFLIAQRGDGTLALGRLGSSRLTAVQGLPAVDTIDGAGVHDVVVEPGTGRVFVSYSAPAPGDRATLAVVSARLVGHGLTDVRPIFRAVPALAERAHFGGRLAVVGDHLFVTVGDRRSRQDAQSLARHNGSIVRLHLDGRVPEDNPFVDTPGARPEIWSTGHRNPQGLLYDHASGVLWAHEHGPQGGDELNRIEGGRNYGWPVISYGEEYGGGPIGDGRTHAPGMEQPVHVWTPSIGPAGFDQYGGEALAGWRGSFLIGALARTHLQRLAPDGPTFTEERLLPELRERVRLVRVAPDGSVLLGTDGGFLLQLRPLRP